MDSLIIRTSAGKCSRIYVNYEIPRRLVIDCSPTNQYHGRITMLTEASTKSKAVRKLEKGCIVLVLGTEGDMTHIALPDAEG